MSDNQASPGDPDPVEFPIDGTLDLHTFRPKDVRDLVHDYIDACLDRGILDLRIVHGKGTGTLRELVHKQLNKNPHVTSFRLGDESSGSWGATLVRLAGRAGESESESESESGSEK